MASRQLRTQNGRSIILANQLGRGGEGTVYEVQDDAAIAVKIYRPDKTAERRQKIEAIVAAQWHKNTSCVAFPDKSKDIISKSKFPIFDTNCPEYCSGRC